MEILKIAQRREWTERETIVGFSQVSLLWFPLDDLAFFDKDTFNFTTK
jgi:hypothetical protein